MTSSAFTPSVLTLPQMGVNKLINGSMAIDQRNSGASKTFTAAAALSYCVDRWYGYCTGANVTGQRVAGTNQAQYRYQFTGAASVTAIGFGQRIEAANCYDLNGRTATLSVDLANSLLTSVTWTAYYANTADTFGTLASPTRTQIATGTFTVSSTVTRYSTQISIPQAATTGIEIVFTVGAQTSGTWTIGNAQLESGSSASNFEQRQAAYELCACQRYYQNNFANMVVGAAYNSTNASFSTPLGITLRSSVSANQISGTALTGCITNLIGTPATYTPTSVSFTAGQRMVIINFVGTGFSAYDPLRIGTNIFEVSAEL